jgi:hypothetical protein
MTLIEKMRLLRPEGLAMTIRKAGEEPPPYDWFRRLFKRADTWVRPYNFWIPAFAGMTFYIVSLTLSIR